MWLNDWFRSQRQGRSCAIINWIWSWCAYTMYSHDMASHKSNEIREKMSRKFFIQITPAGRWSRIWWANTTSSSYLQRFSFIISIFCSINLVSISGLIKIRIINRTQKNLRIVDWKRSECQCCRAWNESYTIALSCSYG